MVDESIRRNRIKSRIIEIDVETIIFNAIARYVRKNSLVLELSGSFKPLKELGVIEADAIEDNKTLRFLNSDVEFFNSFYDGKLSNIEVGIKYIKKETYFRDVFIFINRIKDVARVKSIKLLRNIL